MLECCRSADSQADKQIDDVAAQLRQATRQLIHLMQQLTGNSLNTRSKTGHIKSVVLVAFAARPPQAAAHW